MPLHTACIGLGSNLGESSQLLRSGWDHLGQTEGVFPIALSSPYRGEPVGMVSTQWFINAVAVIKTTLAPHTLLRQLHAIEACHGRNRHPESQGYQDRTLDLDLLLFGRLCIETGPLILPHPRMLDRLFVLAPLAEIAADFIHPGTGLAVGILYDRLIKKGKDQLLEKISWP